MKKSKKSAAGLAEVWMLFVGANGKTDRDLSAKTVRFYLLVMIQNNVLRTALYGSENGFWKDKPLRH